MPTIPSTTATITVGNVGTTLGNATKNMGGFRGFGGSVPASGAISMSQCQKIQYGVGYVDAWSLLNTTTNRGTWGDTGITNGSSKTVSVWVYTAVLNGNWRNVFHVTSDGTNCCSIGQRAPSWFIFPSGTTIHGRHSTLADGNAGLDGGTITVGSVVNLVGVYTATGAVSIYKNGSFAASGTMGSAWYNQISTAIVYAPPPWDTYGDVSIAKLWFFPYAMTAAQVSSYYSATSSIVGTPPLPVNISGTVTTFAGTFNTPGNTDGTGTGASFFYPRDIITDGAGNLYVSTLDSNRLRKIVISTSVVTTVSSSVNGIFGITYDGAGVIYYVNFGGNSIRKYVLSTNVDTLVAGGTNGYLDGTGAGARFNLPRFIAYYAGDLYVADTDNNRIRKVTLAGVVTTLAGSGADASTDGTGTGASFSQPRGIVSDGAGNLYVVEERTFKIRKIVISTAVCTTFAGSTNGFLNGVGTGARFNYMNNIAIDPTGTYLYVGDTNNHAIRKIVISSATVSTVAGTNTEGYVDAFGTSARFRVPFGLCVAGTALYVCDAFNQLIRKIV